jgi:D-alanine-D-alanine ligase
MKNHIKKNLLLLTGPGGDAQGWGNLAVTESLQKAILSLGAQCDIGWVETLADFERVLSARHYDLVWSSLYYLSSREDIIGIPADALWVADLLDAKGIPYIGPDASTQKNLILKYNTHQLMAKAGVRVPAHHLLSPGQEIPACPLPAFVKPNGESRSIGINDDSVCHDRAALERQVARLHQELRGEVLVEEYLPGDEYTVLVLGNDDLQEILPGKVTVSEEHYGKYRILRSDLRGVGITKVSIPDEQAEEAVELARLAAQATNCRDHVRLDMRVGADGLLRVIEINGIPGLKPVKSWSPQIFSLYHPSNLGAEEEYRQMIAVILKSAWQRLGKKR